MSEAFGVIQKQEHFPYKLKPRYVERHLVTCEQVFQWQERKGFLHCIVTGDETWIHLSHYNSKRR